MKQVVYSALLLLVCFVCGCDKIQKGIREAAVFVPAAPDYNESKMWYVERLSLIHISETKAMVSMCFTFLLLGSLIGKHPTALFLIMQTHLCPNIVYTWKPKWPR